MYKLCFKNGLLYASIELFHGGKSVAIDDVIIDTGAFHTIILPDYLEKLDIELAGNDELVRSSGYGGIHVSSVRKRIGGIKLGDISLEQIKIDFGVIDPYERVNGLIGLDFLKGARTVIDMVDLVVYKKV